MNPDAPIWLDHMLVVLLAVVFPIRASTFGFRRLVMAPEVLVPTVRLSLYRQAIALQWSLALATVVLWAWRGRTWHDLGLALRPSVGFWISLLPIAALVAVIAARRRGALNDHEAVASVRRRLRHVERMLPHDRRELWWFLRLSVTAGVCEELLYRGYLIWYLAHWLGVAGGAALATVVFGVGHLYQGPRGVVTTALAGGLMAVLYLASGSLYLGMVAHALADMHSGSLAQAAFAMRDPAPDEPVV